MEEAQSEEREVLISIFEGDPCFKEISANCFQYKLGADSDASESATSKAFLLEITWPSGYPEELPDINLDTFFNKHLPSDLKNEIKESILEQAEEMRGSAMTYSLFDWIREKAEEFICKIPENVPRENTECNRPDAVIPTPSKPKEKKENLTKAQKRRITERTNYKGERERGWNWVDVVKHLCQTGSSQKN